MSEYALDNRSSSPPPVPASPSGSATASHGGPASTHKRVYQACIPCRRRKVRCDLGSVDSPQDPPCVRCRRESKECFFSATRRKRRNDDALSNDEDDYIVRNGRKRLHAGDASPAHAQLDPVLYRDVPLTPGGSAGRTQPLRKPHPGPGASPSEPSSRAVSKAAPAPASASASAAIAGASVGVNDEGNTPLENFEARSVMRREVYGPHDALDLLYKAATDGPGKHDDTTTSTHHHHHDPHNPHSPLQHHRHHRQQVGPSPADLAQPGHDRAAPKPARPTHSLYEAVHPTDMDQDAPIDPELTRRDRGTEPGYSEALRAWARFRFVRAGWFTAQEAIEYIE